MALDASGNPRSSKLYMPYGGWRWGSGNLPTARQFTGQVSDATSGLDYYNARYYDPALGQFVSADTVMDGLNRYAYSGDNPSTNVDPSGHDWWSDAWNNTVNAVGHVLDFVTGFSASISDVQTLTDDKASLDDKIVAGADLTLNVVTDVALLTGVGEGLRGVCGHAHRRTSGERREGACHRTCGGMRAGRIRPPTRPCHAPIARLVFVRGQMYARVAYSVPGLIVARDLSVSLCDAA